MGSSGDYVNGPENGQMSTPVKLTGSVGGTELLVGRCWEWAAKVQLVKKQKENPGGQRNISVAIPKKRGP